MMNIARFEEEYLLHLKNKKTSPYFKNCSAVGDELEVHHQVKALQNKASKQKSVHGIKQIDLLEQSNVVNIILDPFGESAKTDTRLIVSKN